MNKLRVEEDLKGTNLKEKLGHQLDTFVKFAAKERFEYEENIYDEYKAFMNRDKRLCEMDQEAWKRIRLKVFKRDNYTCVYCGKRGGNLEVDHVKPFSKGGSEKLNNLVTSCQKCNRQKRDKSLLEFLEWKVKNNATKESTC